MKDIGLEMLNDRAGIEIGIHEREYDDIGMPFTLPLKIRENIIVLGIYILIVFISQSRIVVFSDTPGVAFHKGRVYKYGSVASSQTKQQVELKKSDRS